MEKNKLFCPAIWFSGFFGLGALVHLVRLVLRVPLMVGSHEIPLMTSAFVVLVFGGLSIGLLILGCKRPCCSNARIFWKRSRQSFLVCS